MISVLVSLLQTLRGLAQSRAALHLEELALHHQLQVEGWKSAPGTEAERSVNGTESHTADAAQHFHGRIALTTPCRGH